MSRFPAALLGATLLLQAVPVSAALQQEAETMTVKGSALENVTIEQNLNAPLPLDASFRDETGKAVRLGDFFGRRPVLMAFAYYKCPMLCTLVLNGIVRVLNGVTLEPGNDFDVVVISINPSETPELARQKKASYLKSYHKRGSDNGWHFLTGDEAQIRLAADAVGFRYAQDPVSKEYAHASAIYVVTPEGRLSHYFFGIEYAARDVKLALVEASKGKIGSLVDRILLFCFHYDPVTGKYSVMIMRLVRLAGILTLIAMAGTIILMLRRERKA